MGGTDLAKLLGVHESGLDALDLYYDKTRDLPDEPEVQNIHQRRGHWNEPIAAMEYWDHTRRSGRKAPQVFTHPDYPAHRAHLDYEIFADPDRPEPFRGTGVLEIKNPSAGVFSRIVEHGVRRSEMIQMQDYLAVSRRSWGSFAFFTTEHEAGPLLVIDVIADRELGDFLLKTGQRFWEQHVMAGLPPDAAQWRLLEAEGAPAVLESTGALTVVKDPEVMDLGRELLEANAMQKRGEALVEALYGKMKGWMESQPEDVRTDRIEVPKVGKFTIVRQSGRATFRADTLRAAKPIDRDKFFRWLDGVSMGVMHDPTLDRDAVLHALRSPDLLASLDLDLAAFEGRGAPFSFLKATDKRPEEAETDV